MIDGKFEKIEGSDFELPCELVLLAMGFLGPQREGLLDALGVELDGRGNVVRDPNFMTNEPGVFACGDMGRGSEPHRVGDRRGAFVRRRGRHLADGGDPAPGADRALDAAAALAISAERCPPVRPWGDNDVAPGSVTHLRDQLPAFSCRRPSMASTGRASKPSTCATGCASAPVRTSS